MSNKDLEIFDGLADSYDFTEAISNTDGYSFLMHEFEEGGRWSNYNNYVFIAPSGRIYKMTVESPATEIQEGQDSIPIEIIEVLGISETVTRYEKLKNSETWRFEVD